METLSEAVRVRIGEALAEDVGAGDWTTQWCVEPGARVEAEVVAKEDGVIAGLAAAAEVYRQLGNASLEALVSDGEPVEPGATVARVAGTGRAVLTGERVALNLLMHLSGVATLTRRFVEAVEGTGARITDTRKTTPLLRELEKAATRAGGAVNHRRALDDMVLIKGNHLACAGGVRSALERVRKANSLGLEVEVEATTLDEVRDALDAGVNRIMLDNMPIDVVAQVMRLIDAELRRPEIEASGGVSLDNVRELAETGVDYISVGALTHSAPALDLSLRIHTVSP